MYIYIHTYAADTCTRGNILVLLRFFSPSLRKARVVQRSVWRCLDFATQSWTPAMIAGSTDHYGLHAQFRGARIWSGRTLDGFTKSTPAVTSPSVFQSVSVALLWSEWLSPDSEKCWSFHRASGNGQSTTSAAWDSFQIHVWKSFVSLPSQWLSLQNQTATVRSEKNMFIVELVVRAMLHLLLEQEVGGWSFVASIVLKGLQQRVHCDWIPGGSKIPLPSFCRRWHLYTPELYRRVSPCRSRGQSRYWRTQSTTRLAVARISCDGIAVPADIHQLWRALPKMSCSWVVRTQSVAAVALKVVDKTRSHKSRKKLISISAAMSIVRLYTNRITLEWCKLGNRFPLHRPLRGKGTLQTGSTRRRHRNPVWNIRAFHKQSQNSFGKTWVPTPMQSNKHK